MKHNTREKRSVLRSPRTGMFYTGRGWSHDYKDALPLTKAAAIKMVRATQRTLDAGRGAIERLTLAQQQIADANVITDYGTSRELTTLVG